MRRRGFLQAILGGAIAAPAISTADLVKEVGDKKAVTLGPVKPIERPEPVADRDMYLYATACSCVPVSATYAFDAVARCRYCGAMNEPSRNRCDGCGAPL